MESPNVCSLMVFLFMLFFLIHLQFLLAFVLRHVADHDKFHLVKHLNAAVDTVRRREVKSNEYLKRTRYLFLKDTAKFTDKQQMKFDAIVNANYEVSRAWRIKEDFRDIIRGKLDRGEAFTLYTMWRQRASH